MSSTKDGGEKSDAPRKSKNAKKDNSAQNIGSMEDCYTNIFALTEVNGLKWKCYRSPSNAPRAVPLTSDPILKAFSKCIREQLMCAWRRKQLPMSENHESLPLPQFTQDMQKELWVFWYNEDPPKLDEICSELEVDEECCSSASFSNTISYEVRTLLYKALHVIMERSLMKEGFIRFGRWFTKPLKSQSKQKHFMYPAYILAMRFNYLILGGNNISVIVHTQRQPTLIKLHRRHLEHNSMRRFAVICGPWSMRGHLVQNQLELLAEPKMQMNAEREYNEWKSFVQLDMNEKESEKEKKADDSESGEGTSTSNENKGTSPAGTNKDSTDADADNPTNTGNNEKNKKKNDSSDEDSDYSDNDDDAMLRKLRDKEKLKESAVPKMILVEIDGVRMLYPSVFVSVTLEDDRHVWEALGFRTTTVPEELIVHGRRPRNKFVVQAGNAVIPFHGVLQQVTAPKTRILKQLPPITRGGFAQPMPPIDEKFLKWQFQHPYELECEKHEERSCSVCRLTQRNINKHRPLLFEADDVKGVLKKLLSEKHDNPDFYSYHRTKNAKTAQMIKLRERQRVLSEGGVGSTTNTPAKKTTKRKSNTPKTEGKKAENGEMKETDDGESSDSSLPNRDFLSQSQPWMLDEENMADWIGCEKNKLSTAVYCKTEDATMNHSFSPTRNPPSDEETNREFSPFRPVSAVSPCQSKCTWPVHSLEEMPEEQFKYFFQPNEKKGKLGPNASRDDKVKEYDHYYNPAHPAIRKTPEYASYHRRKSGRTHVAGEELELEAPFSKFTSIYSGELCENGAFGYQGYRKSTDEKDDDIVALEKARKSQETDEESEEDEVVKLATKIAEIKSVENCVKRLIQIKDKSVRAMRKLENKASTSKENEKEKEAKIIAENEEYVKGLSEDPDEEGFQGEMKKHCGYQSPHYSVSSTSSRYGEDSEAEQEESEQDTSRNSANGNAAGGSALSAIAEEPMEVDMREEENRTEQLAFGMRSGEEMDICDQNDGAQTDGLLSPPASNEMPKSGPLSVGTESVFPRGPPSIEGLAMNQIYPTPPSVQMLDHAQIHSPIMPGKTLKKDHLQTFYEDIERVAVPGGSATVDPYESDDENENLNDYGGSIFNSKISKLMSIMKKPVRPIKRKSHVPLSEKFRTNQRIGIAKVAKKRGIYKKMVDSSFDNPPFDSFAKILSSSKPKKIQSRVAPSRSSHAPTPASHVNNTPNMPHFPPGHPLHNPSLHANPNHSNQIPNPNMNMNMPNQMNIMGMGNQFQNHPMFPQQQPGQFPNQPNSNFNHFGSMTPNAVPGFPGASGGVGGPMMPGFGGPPMGGGFGPGGFGQHMPGHPPQFQPGRGMMGPQQQAMFNAQQQQQQAQMRNPMMMPGAIGMGSRPPPAYSAPSMPPPPQQHGIFPGQFGMQQGPPQSSVLQLSNFVNQSKFGPTTQSATPPFSAPMPILSSPSFGSPAVSFNGMPDPSHNGQQHQMIRQMSTTPGLSPFGQPAMMGMNPINPILTPQQQQAQHQQMLMRQQQSMMFNQAPQPIVPAPAIANPVIPFRKDLPVPEGESVNIAIIMSDTILDLHFDSALDACPICSCTVSIRTKELGLYLTPHEVLRSGGSSSMKNDPGLWSGFNVNSTTACTCGFSAIRHRYLSVCAGLFPDDSNEATASENSVASVAPSLDLAHSGFNISKHLSWFDPSSASDLAVLDQIRQLSQTHSYGKAVSQMAAVPEHSERLTKAMEIGMDVASSSEYVISHVDSMELLMLGNAAIDMCMRSMSMSRSHTCSSNFISYFHPWGLQTANEIREPSVAECRSVLNAISPSLENSIRIARSVITPGNVNIVEGPLTWRKFVQKSLKNRSGPGKQEDETASAPEPIPAVNVATSTESIRAAPSIRKVWGNAQLAPIDQPKDVMYMTIIPDNDVVHAKAVKFMDNLSRQYEKMRLGRHIPFPVTTNTINTRGKNQYGNLRRNPSGANILPNSQNQQNTGADVDSQSTNVEPMEGIQSSSTCTTVENSLKKNSRRELATAKDMKENPTKPATSWDHIKKFSSKSKELPKEVMEREGILRVGGSRSQAPKFLAPTAATSNEFLKMTKHLDDKTGFIMKLKTYIQQMEEMVIHALSEDTSAFERSGFRYQAAIEARAKRERESQMVASGKEKLNALSTEEGTTSDISASTSTSHTETSNTPAPPVAAETTTPTTSAPSTSANNQNQNAPSPIPAGMMPIPETLPENERNLQPTLTELLAEPSSLLPVGGVSNQWVQMDTTMPNPFPFSNQPPVDYEEVGNKDKDDPSTLPHVIVIYMTNPFTWGTDQHTALHMRVSILSFIRAFNSILSKLPLKKRPQVQMEIVGLDLLDELSTAAPDYFNDPNIPMDLINGTGIIIREEERERMSGWMVHETAKSISIAVYTHPRVFFPDCYKLVQPRCMTAFGPGSDLLRTVDEMERMNMDFFKTMNLRGKMAARGAAHQSPALPSDKGFFAYKVPSNLLCLAASPTVYQMQEDSKVVVSPTEEQTLFVAYCLIGADFLIATVTDGQGKLIDNCVVNMKPKNEPHQLYRYKQKTQILDAMGRLWTFILGILASDVKNWRLVVGRLGRIGHGEFRAWTHLLNKTSLLKYSTRLKDICGACNQMPGIVGTPSILSACLITIEPEPNFRLFNDYYDTEFLSKKGKQGQTDYVSCTHITTFPVGAEINYETQDQSADPKADENWDFGDLDMMAGLDDGDTELLKDVGLTEAPQSAAIRSGGPMSFFTDETSNLDVQNQPLASGFYISTSPAPELPDWFWASCPSAKRSIPVHLKSSLHINITEVKNDDLTMESSKEKEKEKDKDVHPLESHQTEDVLRHVLEAYNALSWLNVNSANGERYSCLPIHVQHLLRLYHSIVRLIL